MLELRDQKEVSVQGILETTILEPFERLARQLAQVIPVLVTVVFILIVGGALAYLVRRLTYGTLVLLKFDRLVAGTGFSGSIERTRLFRSPSEFGARVAQGTVWVLIVLFALSAAGTEVTDTLVARFVNYIPDFVTAILVLLLGSAVSQFLSRSALLAAVNAQWVGARFIAGGVRVLLLSLTVVVALEQLRIGRTALLVSFAILFAGIVIAGAIAFGLGGRDLARELLESRVKARPPAEEDPLHHL
jgi:hypothetical protein